MNRLRWDRLRWLGRPHRGVAVVKDFRCERCDQIRAARPGDLVFFWRPGVDQAVEGERVRTLALARHAAAGHPQ